MAESHAFDLAGFLPLLEQYLTVPDPYKRQFLLSWLGLLDSLPEQVGGWVVAVGERAGCVGRRVGGSGGEEGRVGGGDGGEGRLLCGMVAGGEGAAAVWRGLGSDREAAFQDVIASLVLGLCLTKLWLVPL